MRPAVEAEFLCRFDGRRTINPDLERFMQAMGAKTI